MNNLLDFNEQFDLENEIVLIPSGTFCSDIDYVGGKDDIEYLEYGKDFTLTGAEVLFNPFKIPDIIIESHSKVEESKNVAKKIFEEYHDNETKKIEIQEVRAYAAEIVKLGLSFLHKKFDVLICPLRGALKPTNYLKIMGVIEQDINWLPFTGATSGIYDNTIIKYLKLILQRYNSNSELFTISIIDTAIGGHGTNKLSDLIAEVKKSYFPNSNWVVNFYLLHAPKEGSNSIQFIDSIEMKNTNKLKFIIHRHQVSNLIIEDWESAIGLRVDFKGNNIIIKHSIQEGSIIISDNNKVCVIETPEISNYVDVLVATIISEEMLTHPRLKFVRDVWQEYRSK